MNPSINDLIPRRKFLAALAGSVAATMVVLPAETGAQDLLVLKKGDLERLRLDFNSYRDKVRLVAILSPT